MSPLVEFSPPAAPAALHQLVAGRRVAPHGWETHVVQPGETLLGIALTHHTSTGVLVRRNHLTSTRLIKAGTRMQVPRTSPAPKHRGARHHAAPKKSRHAAAKAKHATKARKRAKRPARVVHTLVVRPGDTVSALALRLHVSVATILKANRMSDGRQLRAGQRLRVPGAAPVQPKKSHATKKHATKKHATKKAHAKKAAARRGANKTVTVRPGDTVSGLALQLHVSQTSILRAAGITDAHRLQAGQTLRLRSSAPSHPKKKSHATKKAHAKKAKRSAHNTFEGRTYADSIVTSATRNRRVLASRHLPSRSETKALITRTARRHGIDPKLALAVSYQESGWSQRQVSVANAIGAMQVIPSTGEWASQMVGRKLNLLNPADNVTAGVVVLRALVRSADNERQAIAGYYQGLAGVRAHGMYPDTRRYVANVLYHKKHL